MNDFVPVWRVTRGPRLSVFMAEYPGDYTDADWQRTVCSDRLRRRMVRAGVSLTTLEFWRAVKSMLKTEQSDGS